MELFGGKVWVRRLPELRPPLAPGAPAQKRLLLAQGELAQFHDGLVPIRYLAWIELLPGGVRGNHWHALKAEYLYIIRGEVDLAVAERSGGEAQTLGLQAGDLAFIAPGLAHVLRPRTPGHAVEYSETPFDPADIHPYVFPMA